MEQVLDLEDLGIVGDGLDHAELRPGPQLELEDGQRTLVLRIHPLWRHADLIGQTLEAYVMVILLHRDATGQPLGIGRGRELDGRLVEHLRAIQLVHGVADDDFLDRRLILLRLLGQIGGGFYFRDLHFRCRRVGHVALRMIVSRLLKNTVRADPSTPGAALRSGRTGLEVAERCFSTGSYKIGSLLNDSRSVARSTNCSRISMSIAASRDSEVNSASGAVTIRATGRG